MRIVMCSVFYPYRGGIAQFNAHIYRELGVSHDVHAINFSRQYPGLLFPGKSQLVPEGDEAMQIPSTRMLDSIWPPSWKYTANAIAAIGPDVVIIRHWVSFLAPAMAGVAGHLRKKKIPVILIVDNAIPHEPKWYDRWLINRLFSRVDAFVVMSEKVEKDVRSFVPDARIARHGHPAYSHFGNRISREDAHRQLGTNAGKKTLLFFGFIRTYKGLDLLLDAFSKLDENYQLVIAGECYGPFDGYRKQIDASHNGNNIVLHNRYIPDHEVPAFFSAADVVVLPYRTATQSGIAAIAKHFGTPVIISDAGGLAEGVSNESGVNVVHDLSADGLSSAINEFFKSPPGVIQAEQANEWSSYCASLVQLCQEIKRSNG
ncbi:MAG: glycosyltransferase [Flavobacteriales bacterium]|nr:glycosyltransferase [Flavobacteriales bacterium]